MKRSILNYSAWLTLLVAHATLGKVYQVLIIGGGPAAYSAAISAANAKLTTIVFEGQQPGGQPVKAGEIKNFPGHKSINGAELVSNMREQAEELGAIIVDSHVVNVNFKQKPFTITTDKNEKFSAQTVIIASGSEPVKLNCPGENACWGKGVIVCAKCDGHLFDGKDIAIIGGGYSALRELGNLKPFAKQITLINPDTELSGPQFLINQTKAENVTILHRTQVIQILEKDGHVNGIEIENKDTKKRTTLPVQGVLVGLGWKPSSQLFVNQLKLNKEKEIEITDGDTKTSVPGIFAAGDITNKSRHQLATASASGFTAALDAEAYLREKGFL